jgi:hemolysin III
VVEIIRIEHPKWVAALVYISLGWVAVVPFPSLWEEMGAAGTLLVAAGGLLYTVGAVVYATQRPDPNPRVFGYHEVFHLFVILAAAAHFAAVAFFALPAA